MNITWIHFGSIVTTPEGVDSTLASARYRALIPGAELARRGHRVRFARFHTNADAARILKCEPGECVVISKLSSTKSIGTGYFARKTLELMKRLRANGAFLLVDLSDDHFSKPELASFLAAAPALCNAVVTCSNELADSVRQRLGVSASVIADPVEGVRGEARAPATDGPLRLLWFGHQSNLSSIEAMLPRLRAYAGHTPLALNLLTASECGAEGLVEKGNLSVSFTPWTRAAQQQALADCDLVLIPSAVDSAIARAKSANRLVEAAWAGRFAVASPVPSYRPLASWMWVEEDLIAGLDYALRHPREVTDRIVAAQSYVEAHFGRGHIADQWQSVLELAASAAGPDLPGRKALPVPRDGPYRLHISNGCGNLKDFLNVHLDPARAQPPPDMVCDVDDLQFFADTSLDGLVAVNVLQYFTPGQVPALLAEWRRVLRPGAALAVQCPDLEALCRRVVADGAADTALLTALFGVTAEHGARLPYRSGYTAAGLSKLLVDAGFVDVRRTPPQGGRGAPWDMRLEAEVPAPQ